MNTETSPAETSPTSGRLCYRRSCGPSDDVDAGHPALHRRPGRAHRAGTSTQGSSAAARCGGPPARGGPPPIAAPVAPIAPLPDANQQLSKLLARGNMWQEGGDDDDQQAPKHMRRPRERAQQ